MTAGRPISITTTSDDRQELEQIADALIKANLAACCQISGPIQSVYRWQGKIESTDEWTCSIKTHDSKFDDIEKVIYQMHHYDTPEIIAVKIAKGSRDYLRWMAEQLA